MATDNKYDRQVRLWGPHGQSALLSSRICLLNASATGTETLKNLVLPGCGHITIVDGSLVTQGDVCNNFFVTPEYLGRPRAEATLALLLEMNSDVKGTSVHRDPLELLRAQPDFYQGFSLVIATQMSEESLLPLAASLRATNTPLLIVRTYGLLGLLRTQRAEHCITESKTDNARRQNLNLSHPFPALRALADATRIATFDPEAAAAAAAAPPASSSSSSSSSSPDGAVQLDTVPGVLLVIKALDSWRAKQGSSAPAALLPKNSAQDSDVMAELLALAPGSEVEGALADAVRLVKRLRTERLLPEVRAVLADAAALREGARPAGAPPPTPFWAVAGALRDFAAAHQGFLPRSSTLEDMDASSSAFLALEACYRAQATADAAWVKARVAALCSSSSSSSSSAGAGAAGVPAEEYTERLCRCAQGLGVMRWGSLEEELSGAGMVEAWQDALSGVAQAGLAGAGVAQAQAQARAQGMGEGAAGEEGEGGEEPELSAEDAGHLKAFKGCRLHPALFYLVLRAADRLAAAAAHGGRQPGSSSSSSSSTEEAQALWEGTLALAAELGLTLPPPAIFSSQHAQEVCRYAGAEPHCTAALLGGQASQEAIKLLTAQFVPARCAVWVGVGGQAWALQPNVAEVY